VSNYLVTGLCVSVLYALVQLISEHFRDGRELY